MKLYLMDISQLKAEDIANLSEQRQAKANKYIFERDRKLSLAVGVLLDRGLKEYGLRERDVVFAYGPCGKPYLKDYPAIHFNVSHSQDLAIAVFSKTDIGCDVELLRPYDKAIAQEAFTPKERELLDSAEDKDSAFTQLWVMKESYLKAIGTGLKTEMNLLNIDKTRWKITSQKYNNYYIAICEESKNE